MKAKKKIPIEPLPGASLFDRAIPEKASEMKLVTDHNSYSNRGKVYALAGDRVTIQSDHGHFAIVKNKRTEELFSCPWNILATV